jgi:hypothetical protein
VKQARRAELAGAEALMLLPRKRSGGTSLEVAEATSLPVVLQYAPAQTGIKMSAESLLELNRRAPNVCYVKVESAPPGPLISSITEGSSGEIKCLIGNGGLQLVDGLRRGAYRWQAAPFRAVADRRRRPALLRKKIVEPAPDTEFAGSVAQRTTSWARATRSLLAPNKTVIPAPRESGERESTTAGAALLESEAMTRIA